MITDEMVEVARKECVARIDMDVTCRLTLEAAFPLIRAQVLEEAAKVVDNEKLHPDDLTTPYDEGYNHGCNDCAQAIRNLAGSGPA